MTTVGLGIPRIGSPLRHIPDAAGRPDVDGLIDRFGRVARDLRVSITEKCSLRCTYCMPEQGLPAIARDDLLTPTEIGRLVEIAVRDLGVHDIRFTGGEPLMRPDLAEIIARSSAVAGDASISMTTNGIGLDKRVDELVAAGLTRVNISLDTVDRDHFARLTRRDRLPAVLAGIEAAKRAGLTPLKINAVLMRDTLHGAVALLSWAIENGCRLRFIEQMPLDADEAWVRENMVDAAELLDVLGSRFTLTAPHREDPSAPAEEWLVDGGPATVGIIASVTRSFCDDCDRTRLTAEGTIRSCLFGDDETDLRGMLRSGVEDVEIADRWRAAMWHKQAGHRIASPDFVRPERSMGAIGG
jgi:cyclic pyranopterin phosphate synthase